MPGISHGRQRRPEPGGVLSSGCFNGISLTGERLPSQHETSPPAQPDLPVNRTARAGCGPAPARSAPRRPHFRMVIVFPRPRFNLLCVPEPGIVLAPAPAGGSRREGICACIWEATRGGPGLCDHPPTSQGHDRGHSLLLASCGSSHDESRTASRGARRDGRTGVVGDQSAVWGRETLRGGLSTEAGPVVVARRRKPDGALGARGRAKRPLVAV